MKIYFVLLLVVLTLGRDYPLYNQCDAKWANERLGSSNITICKGGDLISAVAMGLSGIGVNQNPSTLNKWLAANKGYDTKHQYVWASVNPLGVSYSGQVGNSILRINLDVGYLVIINVEKGAHWVLATGYSGNTIFVRDSLHTTIQSYDMTQIVSGHNAVYKVPNSLPEHVLNKYDDVLNISHQKEKKNLEAE